MCLLFLCFLEVLVMIKRVFKIELVVCFSSF